MLCSQPRFSPLNRISQVPLEQIRLTLIDAFKQWGMPVAVRTDNGKPFGALKRDIIPLLSLWLCAWGVSPILNRPRRPTDNAHVENNQRTSAQWAEIYQCANAEQAQAQLDQAGLYQREHYRVTRLGNVTRKQLFKNLYGNKRLFKHKQFDEHKAYELLAQAMFPRVANANGAISIYDKLFSVGRQYRHKVVCCSFDPQSVSWICRVDQQTVKTIHDPRFGRHQLFHLTVCQRTK